MKTYFRIMLLVSIIMIVLLSIISSGASSAYVMAQEFTVTVVPSTTMTVTTLTETRTSTPSVPTETYTPSPTSSLTPTSTLTLSPTSQVAQLTTNDIKKALEPDLRDIKDSLQRIEENTDVTIFEKIRDDFISNFIWGVISPNEPTNAWLRFASAFVGLLSVAGKIYLMSGGRNRRGGSTCAKIFDVVLILYTLVFALAIGYIALKNGIATSSSVDVNLSGIEQRLDRIDQRLQTPPVIIESSQIAQTQQIINPEALDGISTSISNVEQQVGQTQGRIRSLQICNSVLVLLVIIAMIAVGYNAWKKYSTS